MYVALTGATGFLGRHIVQHLASTGCKLRCWRRAGSDVSGLDNVAQKIEWILGNLDDPASMRDLVRGTQAVVHAALYRPGPRFQGGEGDVVEFVERNLVGSIRLIEEARRAGVDRFVFISTCAVHEIILEDRPLDESHPLWPTSHYGAHKAAIEKFIHSYGLGHGFQICALRPCGIYGVAHPASKSKWFNLVAAVARGERIETARGGKEVNAADVAKAVALLLTAPGIAGQAYNCCDQYVADEKVAAIAKRLTGSRSEIAALNKGPRNQISTQKLQSLGMTFGGDALLEATVRELVEAVKRSG